MVCSECSLMNWKRIFLTVALAVNPLLAYTAEQPPDPSLNERVVQLPVLITGKTERIVTTIFTPNGDGPFPTVVMNHGASTSGGQLEPRHRVRHISFAIALLKRGYAVVLPMRPGFGASSGAEQFPRTCDLGARAIAHVEQFTPILEAITRLPFVDRKRVVLAGQSAGGFLALASASYSPLQLRGAIVFAGTHIIARCGWIDDLIRVSTQLGRSSRTSSVWFYGSHDEVMPAWIANRMIDRYTQASGKAILHRLERPSERAHYLVDSDDAMKLWLPHLDRFLASIGLPDKPSLPLPGAARFTRVNLPDAGLPRQAPFSASASVALTRFLAAPEPKAFAISADGAYGYAYGGINAYDRAISECQRWTRRVCHPYLVDDVAVRHPDFSQP